MTEEKRPLITLRIPRLLAMVQEQERYDALRAKLIRRIQRNRDFEAGTFTGFGFDYQSWDE